MQKKIGNIISILLILTFMVFTVLKLTNVINWSWWWITSPVWVPIAIQAVVIVVALIFGTLSLYMIKNKIENINKSLDDLNKKGYDKN